MHLILVLAVVIGCSTVGYAAFRVFKTTDNPITQAAEQVAAEAIENETGISDEIIEVQIHKINAVLDAKAASTASGSTHQPTGN